MASKNVETVRAAHESWNRRDFPGVVRDSAEGLVYTDHGRSLTLNTRDKFREWTEAWAMAFSDGRITNPKYIDGGRRRCHPVYRRRHKRRSLRIVAAHRPPGYPCRSARSVTLTKKGVLYRRGATTTSTRS